MTLRNAPEGFSTRAIHHGYDPLDYHGALNPPVFLTSTYAFDRSDTGSNHFSGEEQGYIYGRNLDAAQSRRRGAGRQDAL